MASRDVGAEYDLRLPEDVFVFLDALPETFCVCDIARICNVDARRANDLLAIMVEHGLMEPA